MKSYKLNDGRQIPVLGFGTWKAKDGEEAGQAVKTALEAGYRHIDTANSSIKTKKASERLSGIVVFQEKNFL